MDFITSILSTALSQNKGKESVGTRIKFSLQRLRPIMVGWSIIAASLIGLTAPARADENIGHTQQPLGVDRTVELWTTRANTIPVCWTTPGFKREKALVQRSVRDTWEYYANLSFTGWGDCPAQGEAQVRVSILDQDDTNSGAGGSAALGTNALSAPGEVPNVTLSFNPDGTADEQRVEYIGVHEFGHVLGFVHEQDLPGNIEGSAHCDTIGVDPNAEPITVFDRDSVMNYCNKDGNGQGRVTDTDILGVRTVYGPRTHFVRSAVVLLGDGQVWRFTGRRCNDTACPGWEQINKDARISAITSSDTRLFSRLGTGQIFVWDGRSKCNGTACPGWDMIDANTQSRQIVASGNTVYQLTFDGSVWKWDGLTKCDKNTNICPSWMLINKDARIASLAASDSKLFARHKDGQLWTWDGQLRCVKDNVCPGWTHIDSNTRSTQIVAAANQLFQLQSDGRIWKWDGRNKCNGTVCPGWDLIDNDPRIKSIDANGTKLFARQGTGELWAWDGRTPCNDPGAACPGWTRIDTNTRSRQIAASSDALFQLHVGGNLWRWEGKNSCKGQVCPGWTLINRDARIIAMQAFVPVPEPSRLSSGTLF